MIIMRKKALQSYVWAACLSVVLAWVSPTTARADTYTFTFDNIIDPNDATYDGHDIVVDGCVLTVNGTHAFESLLVTNNGVVTHTANADEQIYTIDLAITNDLTIEAGSMIDVSGRGYSSSNGPGQGTDDNQYGAGAAYGGKGGDALDQAGGSAYGSILAPVDLGSGGGRTDTHQQGGPGGGVVRLEVGGTLTVTGDIRADGGAGGVVGSNWGGGGSGGSIYITASLMTGVGTVSAIGGDSGLLSGAGGGGGGRIALYADDFGGFGWFTPAHGGDGYEPGGAGTTYFKVNSDAVGALVVDNNGLIGAWTPLTSPEAFHLALRHSAIGAPSEPMTVTNFALNSESVLLHSSGGPAIDLTVQGDAVIDPNTAIDVTGRGYASSSGPGEGGDTNQYAGGAGYGGAGADSQAGVGGAVYGSLTAPVDLGSGGGRTDTYQQGGAGGGAIRLLVTGTLTLNGDLIANGVDGGIVSGNFGGGGSGGSIYVVADAIDGAGGMYADGGAEGNIGAGGGGGGRIAVYHDSALTFTGEITAYGGGLERFGGAGTIYIANLPPVDADLYIDNNGNVGADTDLLPGYPTFNLVSVSAGGILAVPEGGTLNTLDLEVLAGGVISHDSTEAGGFHLNVMNDATIALDGKIDVNYRGFGPRSGPGAGGTTYESGAGGGHGGPGGNGQNTVGGVANGSLTEPTTLGSGGGEEADSNVGGSGGGAVHLDVVGTLNLDGSITANGGSGGGGSSGDNGGGAGGSVWLEADELSGVGAISAIGGNGGTGSLGGGGGGGRIAVYMNTNTFTGSMTACGGTGYQNGGAGTIYFDSVDDVGSACILDNCDISGVETNLPDVTSIDNNVIVRRNAVLTHTGDLDIDGDLTVEDSGLITQTLEQGAAHISTTGDIAVETGGAIDVSGRGYTPRNGPGAGESTTSSGAGGGHGGKGGAGSNTAGGDVYGSLAEPSELGSGGGEETDSNAGGAGGGAIRLTADGTITLDGSILANGVAGTGGSSGDNGGGAGGSIWITAAAITGGGQISAIGGDGGAGSLGGGGGGGRVALYCDDVAGYTGAVAAHAGTGYQNGGAGTIYTKTSAQTYGDVLYDNGGINGRETPFTETDPYMYTIANGAIVYPVEPVQVASIHVADGGVLTHAALDENFHFRVQGDVTVDAGGSISVNGRGYESSTGPGQGGDGATYGGGAGYGGAGGDSAQAAGGGVYGLEPKPREFGSGGGNGVPEYKGGYGGGMINMIIEGVLLVNGELAADGGDGVGGGNPGGGGSGGSILLRAETIDGTGTISADGGDSGDVNSGGGGGGRIALYTCDLQMSSSLITASGGLGYVNGEDGTVYNGSGTVDITEQPQDLVLDPGDPVLLTVTATGDGELTYQWRKGGLDLVDGERVSGAMTDTLQITAFELGDIGAYYVLVTDNCGPFASDIAMVTIPADLDRDGDVDLSDLAHLLGNYGMIDATLEDGDLNGNGVVELSDLAELLGYYGTGA